MTKVKSFHFLTHLALFILVALFYYLDVFALWFHQLPGESDDGLKNFFTLAYHVQFSQNFIWFDGMNYPFGEHVLFTDNQPLISWVLKTLNYVIPLEGSLHLMMVLVLMASFMAGSWFLFATLRRFDLNRWMAHFAALGIIFLSPQWIRLSGHYSLTHGIVIPLVFYLIICRYQSDKSSPWWLIGTIFLSGFIHPYFLMMLTVLVAGYLVIEMIGKVYWKHGRKWVEMLLIVVVPLLAFQLFMWLTDPVADRPEVPYGYLIYRATLPSILLPFYADYGDWVFGLLPSWKLPAGEGSFYIGISAIIGSLIGVFLIVKNILLKIKDEKLKFGFWLFLACIPLLLLSVGFPFIFEPFENLLDKTGPLKQFRGIGRFSFVVFYGANLLAIVALSRIKINGKLPRYLVIVAILILYVEGFRYSKHIVQSASQGSSALIKNNWPEFEKGRFDAILPLPYYHIGSENFRAPNHLSIQPASMALSLKNGIPLIAVQLSRTSLKQTIQLMKMTSEQLTNNPLALEHQNENWLLLVDSNAELPPHQLKLISKASFLAEHNGFKMYALSPKVYQSLFEENLQHIKEQLQMDSALITLPSKAFNGLYQSFDQHSTDHSLDGSGAAHVNRQEWTDLIPKGISLNSSEVYELSFWIKATDQHAVNTQIWYWERFGGEELEFRVTEIGDHVSAIHGEWMLCSITIRPQKMGSQFEVLLHRDDEPMKIWVDEVLLRPLSQQVTKSGSINLNNRFYQPMASDGVN